MQQELIAEIVAEFEAEIVAEMVAESVADFVSAPPSRPLVFPLSVRCCVCLVSFWLGRAGWADWAGWPSCVELVDPAYCKDAAAMVRLGCHLLVWLG